MKFSKIVLIVLLFLTIPISSYSIAGDDSVDVYFKQCKFMNKLVLDSIRLSKPAGNLSDP